MSCAAPQQHFENSIAADGKQNRAGEGEAGAAGGQGGEPFGKDILLDSNRCRC